MNTTTRLLLVAITAALTGCQTTRFQVMEADQCPVPPAQVAAQCVPPRTLADGATYDDLVALAIEDAENLKRCAEQTNFLSKSIALCNASIDQHNARIREINAKTTGSR